MWQPDVKLLSLFHIAWTETVCKSNEILSVNCRNLRERSKEGFETESDKEEKTINKKQVSHADS